MVSAQNMIKTAENPADTGWDGRLKQVWSNRSVFALYTCILYKMLSPKSKYTFNDVYTWIAEGPYVDTVPAEEGATNKSDDSQYLRFLNNENAAANEGKVLFDVLAKVVAGKMHSMLIDTEFQNKIHTKYPMANRIYFYDERLLASSKEREFTNSNFQDMPTVLGVWILLDPPAYMENTMVSVPVAGGPANIVSYPERSEAQLEKIKSFIHPTFKQMIYAVGTGKLDSSRDLDVQFKSTPDLVLFCNVFTCHSKGSTAEKCLQYLFTKYDVPTENRKQVSNMQNMVQTFQEYFEDQGYAKGYGSGYDNGVLNERTLKDKQLYKKTLSLVKLYKLKNIEKSEAIEFIVALGFSEAEAEKLYNEA